MYVHVYYGQNSTRIRLLPSRHSNAHTGFATAQDEAVAPIPEEPAVVPAPPPPPPSCSYKGYFSIKTNFVACGVSSKYLGYIYPKCSALRVKLLTKRQLYPKALRAVWAMNGASKNGTETATTIKTYMRSKCAARYLQDTVGTNLSVNFRPTLWAVRPMGDDPADCYSNVGLYSIIERKYLAMDASCGSFTLTENATAAAASFKLIKLRI